MNALTFVLAAVVVVLVVALVASRRRVRDLVAASRRMAPILTAESGPVETAARLAPIGIVVVDETGRPLFENDSLQTYVAATGDTALVSLRLRNLFAAAIRWSRTLNCMGLSLARSGCRLFPFLRAPTVSAQPRSLRM